MNIGQDDSIFKFSPPIPTSLEEFNNKIFTKSPLENQLIVLQLSV